MLSRHYFLSQKLFPFSWLLTLLVVFPVEATAETILSSQSETARYQSNLGAYFWQKGDFNEAIDAWSQEAEIYRERGLAEREAEAQIKISQTYISLGQLKMATFQLKKVLSLTQEPSLLASAWNQLGNAYSRDGVLDKALSAYSQSLEIKRNLSTLNNLVRLQRKQGLYAQLQADSSREGEETEQYLAEAEFHRGEAVKYAQEALAKSESEESLASLQTLIEWGKVSPAVLSAQQLERGRRILEKLPASRTKVFLAINWAKLDSERTDYWLSQSAEVAETTGDVTAKSYVFLERGLLAEKSGQLAEALESARSAIGLALTESVDDALYRSYWLAGRINQKLGEKEAAFQNILEAIVSFESLNQGQGVTKLNVEQRLNFSPQIEPMYRAALEFLLEEPIPNESNLRESLSLFGKLRLAQLQNYFGDNCFELELNHRNSQVEKVKKNSVVLFSILLKNQTHLILQLSDGTLRHSRASIGKAGVTKLATDWHSSLAIDAEDFSRRSYRWQFWQQGQDLYDMIVRPFERELEQINPDTIIFVHDGVLRNLPMAALYDAEKEEFLAQKWASVSSVGLKFKPKINQEQELAAVAFGLGVAREGWSALAQVEQEIENVTQILGGKSFLNEEFTTENLAQSLKDENYSLVHLATHGYFGGIAENSLILAYDKPLDALELEDVLGQSQAPIEFLVLSACETALSSEFSALGLAGVALRSGVDSVLGSFWAVQDNEQRELIQDFYRNIYQKNMDKAQALQQIQTRQIERNAHPSKWAAFNLIEEQ